MFELDDPGRCATDEQTDAIERGSLDELLALNVVRAPSACLVRTSHPVVELRAALEREEIAPALRTGAECASVSRGPPPRFGVVFGVHGPEASLVFEAAPPGVRIAVEDLANSWFAALPPDAVERNDEWKASRFAGAVLAGLRNGFFRLD